MIKGQDGLGKGTIHILGGKEQDRVRLHHATQNGMQFKTHELFISGVFHLIFLDHGGLQVTETADKGKLLYALWLQ